MSDTADNLAANPPVGANQTGSLMEAAAQFGALRSQPEPEETPDEPVDDGQTEAESEPEPEDDADEAEAEGEAEPEGSEDDGEPEELDEGTKPEPRAEQHEIKLPDGSTAKVNLDELKQGYLRDADYRRKTHALGLERRKLEEAQNRLDEVVKKLGPLAPEEEAPDWDKKFEEDPIGTFQDFVKWQGKQQARQQAMAEQAAIQHQRQVQAQQAQQERLQREQEALMARPEFKSWSDPDKASAHQKKLRTYAQSIGFEPEDLDGVTDHRVLVVLEKARRLDELSTKSKAVEKVATPAPKVRKPGPANDPKSASDDRLAQAKKSLARTGSAYDAARAMAALNKVR